MTPAEIQALIDANEAAETVLRVELVEAIAKIAVDGFFAQLAAIQVDYDAETITAVKAEYEIETLLS